MFAPRTKAKTVITGKDAGINTTAKHIPRLSWKVCKQDLVFKNLSLKPNPSCFNPLPSLAKHFAR
jgi:hypothetical protein